MAFRGGAVASAGSGSSQVITVSGIGIQLNDIVLLSLEDFIGNTPVFPSGFAQVPGTNPGPNDGNVGLIVYWKLATGSEPTTYTITGLQFGQAVTCRVYSGRNTSSPFTTQSQTAASSANPTPITFAATGLTAAAGDDVVIFEGGQFGTPQVSTPVYTPDAAFANGLIANDSTNGVFTVCSDHVNVSAGATGSIAGGMTFTSGGNTKYVAQVISIAAAPVPLAVRQACVGESGSTSVLFQNASFASATLAGSTIFVVAKAASLAGNNSFSGFADAVNGNYIALETITDATAIFIYKAFVFQNAQSIGTAQALTVTSSASKPHLGFVAFEIQGTTPNSLAAHTAQLQTIASAASDAISSGTVQAGIGSAIAVAVSSNTTGNAGATSAPNVGTGFTVCPSPGGNFWSSFGGLQARAEFQLYTNPGGIPATFTAQAATSDNYITFIAVFNSIGGAFVPTFTANQWVVNDVYIQQ